MKTELLNKIIVNNTTIKFFLVRSFIFVLFLAPSVKTQNLENPSLVKVGSLNISKSEFIYRLNFTPKEGIQDKTNSEGIKKELLYTLIAEKLWANEAIERGFENEPSVLTAKRSIEKMFVRDALYQKEIKNYINVSEDEISEGLKKNSQNLEILLYYSNSSGDISKIYNSLKEKNELNGINKNLDSANVIHKTVNVSFGDLPVYIEDIIYKLNITQFTPPLEYNNGWNLYYLKNRTEKNIDNEIDAYKYVLKTIKSRKEDDYYQNYYDEFFKDVKVDVDGKLFLLLSEEIHKVFNEKENKATEISDEEKKDIYLDTRDVSEILESIGENESQNTFVRFENEPISLESFVREISFTAFSVPENNMDTIKVYLNRKTKEYIKYELLSREGYRQGLDNTKDVMEWTKIWYENFLFQFIKNNINYDNYELAHRYLMDNQSESENLFNNSNNELFENYINETIKLADKYKYEVNEKIFSKIKQGNINLFVLRHLGFGGTISGVPSAHPFIEWYLELQKREEINKEKAL